MTALQPIKPTHRDNLAGRTQSIEILSQKLTRELLSLLDSLSNSESGGSGSSSIVTSMTVVLANANALCQIAKCLRQAIDNLPVEGDLPATQESNTEHGEDDDLVLPLP